MLGASGTYEIKVTGRSPGIAAVFTEYKRYWEPYAGDALKFRCEVEGEAEPEVVEPTLVIKEPVSLDSAVTSEPVLGIQDLTEASLTEPLLEV